MRTRKGGNRNWHNFFSRNVASRKKLKTYTSTAFAVHFCRVLLCNMLVVLCDCLVVLCDFRPCCVIFGFLPKTAKTYLRTALSVHLGPGNIWTFFPDSFGDFVFARKIEGRSAREETSVLQEVPTTASLVSLIPGAKGATAFASLLAYTYWLSLPASGLTPQDPASLAAPKDRKKAEHVHRGSPKRTS